MDFAGEPHRVAKGERSILRPSYQMAQGIAATERMSVSQQSLHQRLRESGLLASVDEGRVRRMIEGKPRQVLVCGDRQAAGDAMSGFPGVAKQSPESSQRDVRLRSDGKIRRT